VLQCCCHALSHASRGATSMSGSAATACLRSVATTAA
jgi:hypothetical protein